MDFNLTPEQEKRKQEYWSTCRELSKFKPDDYMGVEGPYGPDTGWEYHRYCAKEFAKRGWLALGWPERYGGSGDMMDRFLFSEAIGYFDVAGIDGFGVSMLAPTLIHTASEEVKQEFLPPIANAEVQWCELWSEPNAGSDLAAVTTTAIKKGDEYIINGQKTWTTAGHRADWGFGIFKSDLSAPKHKNLTFLLLDMKTKGVEVRPLLYMDGSRLYNEVYFDDVHVPARNVVGKEGGGWTVVNALAAFERSGVGGIMGIWRALEELVEFCNQTRRGGIPLSRDPIVRNRLAQVACELEASRTLAYRVADLQNRNEMSLMDASAVKVYSTEVIERFALMVTDLLGPYGGVKYSKWAKLKGYWEKLSQQMFMYTIAAGTNEIQRNIIAWYGLGLPRP